MRSIWLGNRRTFEMKGKVLEGGLCLGDVDNDGEWELIIGNTTGGLCVFKGEELWQSIGGLGAVAVVGVGDLMNCGSNVVVIVSVDGRCHVYLCLNNAGEKLRLVHKQQIPPNAHSMCIGDVLGDGHTYLVLAFTDRQIRLYKWAQNPTEGSLTCLNKTECPSQIGSICLSKNETTRKSTVYVAQPGLNYLRLQYSDNCTVAVESHSVEGQVEVVGGGDKAASADPIMTSQVIASVGPEGATALVLLDGSVHLIDGNKTIRWSLELEQQTFKSAKVRVSPEVGGEQIVAAAWSGQTFVIDTAANAVMFDIGQPIQTFTAGSYGPRGSTAFVYVTFENKIILCLNVVVESLDLRSPSATLAQDPALQHLSPAQLAKLTQYLLYDFPKRH